jgi:ribosomal protein S18 acetylase RimI-like enzyme
VPLRVDGPRPIPDYIILHEQSVMATQLFTITPVRTATDLSAAIQLIQAYTTMLGFSLSFQDFDTEMANMPGKYAPPAGELLLARSTTGEAIGCVAMRPIEPRGCCEMKRLYVTPVGRGTGVGKALANAIIDVAERLGYREMRLDTLESMKAAAGMYQRLGFVEIEKYYVNPMDGVRYMGKKLEPQRELKHDG